MTKEIKKIKDLVQDPHNANKHNARGTQAVQRSLDRYGAGRSILVDRNGVIIAGNSVAENAERAELPVRVVKTDGQELVVVQREDLDLLEGEVKDNPARALAYADNRAAELGLEWDYEVLRADLEAGLDLEDIGWQDYELEPVLAAPWVPPDLDGSEGEEHAPETKASGAVNVSFTGEQWARMSDALATLGCNEGSNAQRILKAVCGD